MIKVEERSKRPNEVTIFKRGLSLNEIMELLKEKGEIVNGCFDNIFKSVLGEEKLKGILALIITEVLNSDEDLEEKETLEDIKRHLVIKNSEHKKRKIKEHGNSSDLVVDISNKKILLEMNRTLSPGLFERNSRHLSKGVIENSEIKINNKITIQINFDVISPYDDRFIINFKMRDKTGKYTESPYGEKTISYHINLEHVWNKWYNGKKLTKFEKVLVLLQLNKKKDIEELSMGDEELMEMSKKLEDMSTKEEAVNEAYEISDAKLVHDYDVEYSFKEGKKDGQKEIAKKLLQKGLDISEISQITSLTESEINKLK